MMKMGDRGRMVGRGAVGRRQRVGVLGTFVWDTIRHPAAGGSVVEQLGGIAYSLAAIPAALPPQWEIVPLVRVGSDLASTALRFLEGLPGIGSAEGIRVTRHPNNRVELVYSDDAERTERLTGGVPSWEVDDLLSALADLDALYINFIAGNEVDLDTARTISANFEGRIYADLHSLFLGAAPAEGPRPPRRLPNAAEWLRCFDFVQLNESELDLLNVDRVGEDAFLRQLLMGGPEIVCVTRGGEGARIAFRLPAPEGAAPEFRVCDVPIAEGPLQGDPTGCGDVWGSVAFASLLAGLEPPAAAARANRAAAARLQVRSIEALAERIAREIQATG